MPIFFREVMVRLATAARKEASQLGLPYRPLAVPFGDTFRVFANREIALRSMGSHDGHGWVVLCGVTPGIRAVPEAG